MMTRSPTPTMKPTTTMMRAKIPIKTMSTREKQKQPTMRKPKTTMKKTGVMMQKKTTLTYDVQQEKGINRQT